MGKISACRVSCNEFTHLTGSSPVAMREVRYAASRPILPPTVFLPAWGCGDGRAFDRLAPLVHDELHRVALHDRTSKRTGQTPHTSALVNDAYTRLIDVAQIRWQNQTHFFAIGELRAS